jgi:hypothetical protein
MGEQGISRHLAAPLLALLLFCSLACQTPRAGTQTVSGLMIDLNSRSIQQAESFTLRTDDGRELEFSVSSDFNQGVAHPMTPGHLRQHMALADPVRVTYRTEGTRLVATAIEDANS